MSRFHRSFGPFALFLGTFLLSTVVRAESPVPAPVGVRIDTIAGSQLDGKAFDFLEASRGKKAIVIAFVSAGCPVNNLYATRLNELASKYKTQGVLFLGINSHLQEDLESLRRYSKEFEIDFPLVKDVGTQNADRFSVERVPTVFVLDAERMVRYKGRIDDQFAPGVKRNNARSKDLADALDAVLASSPVTKAYVPAAGCLLSRSRTQNSTEKGTVTYAKVQGILAKHCVECHRAGDIGPFSLENYEDVASWADMIREVVSDGRMPPWHLDAPHGKFKNDRRLSSDDKKTILTWIEHGYPAGDLNSLKQNLASAGPEKTTKEDVWTIGVPDLVMEMRESFEVPAQSPAAGIPYKYFLVGEPLAEDTYLQAIEAKPGARDVVHHILINFMPPEAKIDPQKDIFEQVMQFQLSTPSSSQSDEIDVGDLFGKGFLTGYVPGDKPIVYPEGFAKFIPKGSWIAIQVHYTANGRKVVDKSKIALKKAAGPTKHLVKTKTAARVDFIIPPLVNSYTVKAKTKFTEDSMITSINPHMHVRGKAFKFELVKPDGQRELLGNVPKFDFNWQQTYLLANAVFAPKGSSLECTAVFDNSTGNPSNPNPFRPVMWGDQTWDEMVIGYAEYYPAGK